MQSIHFYPPTRHIDKQPSRQRCAHPYINRCLSPYRHSWAGALRRAAAKVCRRRHQPPHLVCAPGRRSVVFDRSRDRRTGEGAPRPGTPSREPASSGGARSLSPGGWLASRVGVWCVDGALRAESWDPGCALSGAPLLGGIAGPNTPETWVRPWRRQEARLAPPVDIPDPAVLLHQPRTQIKATGYMQMPVCCQSWQRSPSGHPSSITGQMNPIKQWLAIALLRLSWWSHSQCQGGLEYRAFCSRALYRLHYRHATRWALNIAHTEMPWFRHDRCPCRSVTWWGTCQGSVWKRRHRSSS